MKVELLDALRWMDYASSLTDDTMAAEAGF